MQLKLLPLLCLAVCVVCAGCSDSRSRGSEAAGGGSLLAHSNVDTQSRTVQAVSQAAVDSARLRFSEYLQRSLETDPRRAWDVAGCVPDHEAPDTYVIGGFKVIAVNQDGGDLRGIAELAVAAREEESTERDGAFVITRVGRIDTLSWRLARGKSGEWGVCGYGNDRVDLGSYGREDNVMFRPTGFDRKSMLALGDSLAGR